MPPKSGLETRLGYAYEMPQFMKKEETRYHIVVGVLRVPV